jgi:hypothetical protein
LLLAITFQTVARPPEKLGFVNAKLGAHAPRRFKLGAAALGGGFLSGFRFVPHPRAALL